MRGKSPAKWGVQIAGMIFQTRSKVALDVTPGEIHDTGGVRMDIQVRREEAVEKLRGTTEYETLREGDSICESSKEVLWDTMSLFQEHPFYTAKKLEFVYHIRGNEMFVSRKEKSITRASVMVAFCTAVRLRRSGQPISGPKKLNCFGASYLYPVFQRIGVI